jgi:subtilisin family serine protease
MKKCLGILTAATGLILSFLLLAGDPARAVVTHEEVMTKWDLSDFVDAKSFICSWQKGKAEEVVKVCEDLGFDIVDTTPTEKGVVCKWKGKLDKEKLAALQKHENVRYVEPNALRWIAPNATQGDVQQTIEFKPVYTSDNVREALKESKRMICAWEKGKKEGAVKIVDDLGLQIVDVKEEHWLVCTWKGELKQETIKKLTSDPSIRYIEPDWSRGIAGSEGDKYHYLADRGSTSDQSKKSFALLPQDEFVNELYGMRNIDAPLAWRNVQTSPVIVAVCDTGVDYTHEDLRDNMWVNPKKGATDIHGADFVEVKVVRNGLKVAAIPGSDPRDRHYHGTHVAGTIGAVGNNRIGVCGVCWRTQIMAVRCLGADGFATANSVAKSIDYAVNNGAKVINLSLGGRKGPLQTELEVVKSARDKGVILVISAGNKQDDVTDNDKKDAWPANYTKFVDNIVVVANTDMNNRLNPGSHFGRTTVHLAAPGTDILSTMPMSRTEGYIIEEEQAKKAGRTITRPTRYGRLTGTSMSAPHVSGAIALLLGHPKYQSLIARTPAEVKSALFNATKPLGDLDGKMTTGGLLDLSFLGETSSPPPIPPKTP